MTLPLFNIGGLASGLDTNSIVSQLIQIERIPINQLEYRRTFYQERQQAWDDIATRISALREQEQKLSDAAEWRRFSLATSSNPDAVAVAVTGSPATGATSFTVDQLAAAHQVAATGTFGAATDLVGAGTFTLTVGGTNYDVTTTSTTTVGELVSQINGLGVGVSASLLQVTSGQYRLVLTADQTGAASAFTATADQASLGTFDVVQQGVDAQLTIGSGTGAITVNRSSNVVDDLIDGVELTLATTTTAPVTVSVDRDLDAATEAVRGLVDELNSTLSLLDDLTAYNAEANQSGPLTGDASARDLELSLRSKLSGVVPGLSGPYTFASSVGISLTRTGSFTFDETAFRAALEDDFDAVAALFGRATTATDPRVSVAAVRDSSLDGIHAVEITQAASVASVTGTTYTAPTADETFDITSGTKTATVTILAGSDLATAVQAINDALSAAGISTVKATSSGGAIRLDETRYGSAFSFTVAANSFGLAGTFTGTDVAGTIGGVAATGTGRSLQGTGTLDGLILTITASAAEVAAAGGTLSLGTVSITSGLASRFDEYLETVEGTDGVIDRARDRWASQIELLDDRIEDLEDRIAMREEILRRQFTAMETALSRLTATSQSLGAALAGLVGGPG